MAPSAKNASEKFKRKKVLDRAAIAEGLKKIQREIVRDFPTPENLLILGIRTRGVTIAERLVDMLENQYGERPEMGILDITLYRDDLADRAEHPMVRDSEIPVDLTGVDIVLVDDVLYTGRTIRAALDEITDYGRPDHVRLAVLIDRGGREYPIQADYIGKTIKVKDDEFVRLHMNEVDDEDEVEVYTR